MRSNDKADQVVSGDHEMLTEGDAEKYKATNPRSSAAARQRRKVQRLKRSKKSSKRK